MKKLPNELNLNEIFFNALKEYQKHTPTSIITSELCFKAMRAACEKAIDLCAENAKLKKEKVDYGGVRAGCYYTVETIDKESILDIKKQIISMYGDKSKDINKKERK